MLSYRPALKTSLMFLVVAAICLPFADLQIYPSEPLQELQRILHGVVTPHWYDWSSLVSAIQHTLAFAFLATAVSVGFGLVLATLFSNRLVRVFCASIRAVHELFWALILMQVFGLSATTGILAIIIPYTGIFAKVFSEILEQQSRLAEKTLAPNTDHFSRWVYTRFAQTLPSIKTYVRYRFECAIRSSTILGFIGLPTLGFYFESAFKEGHYSEAACLLWVFYLLIASLNLWLNWKTVSLCLVLALFALPDSPPLQSHYFWQFISHDIWPIALQQGHIYEALRWYANEFTQTLLPAAVYTLILSVVALVASGILALLLYPIASQPFMGRFRIFGHTILLFLRSTPEIVIAFVLLLLFGPSALPAVIALAIHNGGLIAYLIARESDRLSLRADAARGINLYSYELTPRLFPRVLSFLLYRWEVIMRETAILGLLGVATLGFYIDSAFEELRYDRAFMLVVVAALMNIAVDEISRKVRAYSGLKNKQLFENV